MMYIISFYTSYKQTAGASYVSSFLHRSTNIGIWLSENRGTNVLDGGAPFYQVYPTKDGKYMAVGAIETQFYTELLKGNLLFLYGHLQTIG